MIKIKTPATHTSLTSVNIIKTELDIDVDDDNDFIDHLILESSDFIATWTSRVFPKQEYVESLGSLGGPKILLTHTPVLSIDSIVDNGSLVLPIKYEIENPDAGIIWNEAGWRSTRLAYQYIESFPISEGKRSLVVTYTAGYVMPGATEKRTLPYDLERACIDMVKVSYLRRNEDTRIKHQSVDETFEILTDEALSPSTLRILERYRRIGV